MKISQETPMLEHFLIKWRAFWPANLLKRYSETGVSCEYLEVVQNTHFEVESLENEIHSCFLMSEAIDSLLGRVKKVY